MGLDSHDLEVFVEAYQGDENGHPAPVRKNATGSFGGLSRL